MDEIKKLLRPQFLVEGTQHPTKPFSAGESHMDLRSSTDDETEEDENNAIKAHKEEEEDVDFDIDAEIDSHDDSKNPYEDMEEAEVSKASERRRTKKLAAKKSKLQKALIDFAKTGGK